MADVVITRQEAFLQGKTHYFTGIPCRQGHIAPRYVSTGSCIECQNPYKTRRHPHRKDLQPYVCAKLWVPVGTTPEQYERLSAYLQTCIDTFFAHEAARAAQPAASNGSASGVYE
jgi:hypothetical protein